MFARSVHDEVHAQISPRHIGGIFAGGIRDFFAINYHLRAFARAFAIPAAMHAIEVEQMCRTGRIAADFVNVYELHFWVPPQSPSRQTANAAKAIDCDFDCHM
jgi:hypothetical protein